MPFVWSNLMPNSQKISEKFHASISLTFLMQFYNPDEPKGGHGTIYPI